MADPVPMKIVADENIPDLEAFFGQTARILRVPGRSLSAADVRDADALLVRSVTRVDERLLAGSRVGFVGTATIGTDHLDIDWLEREGIAWSSAPGCNAPAVVDYVLGVIALAALEDDRPMTDYSVGIVGAGNVGGRLRDRLSALGMSVQVNDPPRQAREPEGGFTSLDRVLGQDVVCLHAPLTHAGDYPSFHLLDDNRLSRLEGNQILISAGRGAVVDNQALLRRLRRKSPPRVALDVWENEPAIDLELSRSVWLGTPHIAGYSLEGRLRGTAMVAEAFERHFNIARSAALADVLPQTCSLTLPAAAPGDPRGTLANAILTAYDPSRDSRALADVMTRAEGERAKGFDRLRRDYPVRREFASHTVSGIHNQKTAALLAAAGFQTPFSDKSR